jgi:hypothetical protein
VRRALQNVYTTLLPFHPSIRSPIFSGTSSSEVPQRMV